MEYIDGYVVAVPADMEKAYVDDRLKDDNNLMPFDGSRMIFGGFQVILDE